MTCTLPYPVDAIPESLAMMVSVLLGETYDLKKEAVRLRAQVDARDREIRREVKTSGDLRKRITEMTEEMRKVGKSTKHKKAR